MQAQFKGITFKGGAELCRVAVHEPQGFSIGLDGFLCLTLAQEHVPMVEKVLRRRLVKAGDAVIVIVGAVIVTQQE